MYTGCIHYCKYSSSYGYDLRNENVRPRNIYGCVLFAAREDTDAYTCRYTQCYRQLSLGNKRLVHVLISLSHTHTPTQLIFAKLLVSLMTIYWVLQYYMYLVEHPWCQWEVSAGIISAYKNGLCPACFSSLLRATSSKSPIQQSNNNPFLALVAGVSPAFRRTRCTSSSDENCYKLKEPVRNQLLLPPYEWVSFSLDL